MADGGGEVAAPGWVDAVPAALVVFGVDGVEAANDLAGEQLGVDSASLLGAGLRRLVAEKQRDEFDRLVADVREGNGARAEIVVGLEADPSRFIHARLQRAEQGRVNAVVVDASEFFRVMQLLAYGANTTMVIDEAAQIIWGPVGRYAAQELDSPWYGRGEANPLGWLHPEDIPRVLDGFNRVMDAPGVVHEMTVRTRHVLIEDLWGVATIRAINLLDDPLVHGILVTTQAQGPEEMIELGRTTGSFRSIAEAAPIGIILSDHLGRPLYWNEVARALFSLGLPDRSDGSTEADADWLAFADNEHEAELRRMLDDALGGGRAALTARFVLPGGDTRWLSVTVAPQENDVGEPMGWLATLQDITNEKLIQSELEDAQERLVHLASHDPLTGLANRRLLAEQLARALARMQRDQQGLAVLFCDLDLFKPVNDTRGHDTGDAVLVEIASRISASIRTNDLAARLGGDEFVVMIEGYESRAEIEVVAERVITAACEPIIVNGEPVAVGVSIGVAVAHDGDTPDSLLSRADDLMYRAKAAGRGRYELEA